MHLPHVFEPKLHVVKVAPEVHRSADLTSSLSERICTEKCPFKRLKKVQSVPRSIHKGGIKVKHSKLEKVGRLSSVRYVLEIIQILNPKI
jgi:hypothetical protein